MDFLTSLEELRITYKSSGGYPCSAGEFLSKLKDNERESFEEILETRSVPVVHLVRLAEKYGHRISPSALYKHRLKDCRCFH